MGIQMIVISLSALALVGMVNREGVDTTAAFGVAMQLWTYVQMPAMALGAAVSAMAAQNIGAGKWDRVEQITRVGIVQSLLITGALIVAADARRPDGARPVHGRGQPGAADRPAHPPARDLELPVVRRDDGAVRHGSGQRRGVGAADHSRHRPGAGSLRLHLRDLSAGSMPTRIWTSFPVTLAASTSRLRSAYYLHGGWKKARMTVEERPVRGRMHRGSASDARAGRRTEPCWVTSAPQWQLYRGRRP